MLSAPSASVLSVMCRAWARAVAASSSTSSTPDLGCARSSCRLLRLHGSGARPSTGSSMPCCAPTPPSGPAGQQILDAVAREAPEVSAAAPAAQSPWVPRGSASGASSSGALRLPAGWNMQVSPTGSWQCGPGAFPFNQPAAAPARANRLCLVEVESRLNPIRQSAGCTVASLGPLHNAGGVLQLRELRRPGIYTLPRFRARWKAGGQAAPLPPAPAVAHPSSCRMHMHVTAQLHTFTRIQCMHVPEPNYDCWAGMPAASSAAAPAAAADASAPHTRLCPAFQSTTLHSRQQ
jgi:hypothetical protein